MEFAGGGFNAEIDQQSGELNPLWVIGSYAGYQHWWSETLRSTVTAGVARVEDYQAQAANDLRQASTMSGNVFWNPMPSTTIGVEGLYGRQENTDDKTDDAFRLHALARFSF